VKIGDSFRMKPCPFCGAGGKHLMFLFDGNTRVGQVTGHVNCQPCGARGPREVPTRAIEAWNDCERVMPTINPPTFWDK